MPPTHACHFGHAGARLGPVADSRRPAGTSASRRGSSRPPADTCGAACRCRRPAITPATTPLASRPGTPAPRCPALRASWTRSAGIASCRTAAAPRFAHSRRPASWIWTTSRSEAATARGDTRRQVAKMATSKASADAGLQRHRAETSPNWRFSPETGAHRRLKSKSQGKGGPRACA